MDEVPKLMWNKTDFLDEVPKLMWNKTDFLDEVPQISLEAKTDFLEEIPKSIRPAISTVTVTGGDYSKYF